MAFLISQEGDNDIVALYEIGARTYGLESAAAYAAQLRERFQFLAEFPRSVRERDEVTPPVRIAPFRGHIIAYRIESEDVVVIRVLHHSADWQSEL